MEHVLECSGYGSVKTDMVRAEGCYVYDAAGRRYVDLEAGDWSTALGHSHPRLNQVMHAQIDQVITLHFRYKNQTIEEAAVAVLGALGRTEGQCLFLSSGSEAVEFGVQAARRLSGRPFSLTLADSYLAAYGSAGRKAPEEWVLFDWQACATCPEPACAPQRGPQCPRLQAIPFDRIGALVFEPGNAGGRVKLPPRPLVQALAAQVKQHQGLVLANEVTTGLGRTGAWFGFEHYALEPDIVSMGKGLGNGYPVSAVVMTPAVAGQLASQLASGGFHYAQSHQNDPLGCAIAREVIALLREEGLVERSRQVGARFVEGLTRLAAKHAPAATAARGRGLMTVLELAPGLAPAAYARLLARGWLAGCKPAANLLRFYPALSIPEDDLARLLEDLDETLAALRAGGAPAATLCPGFPPVR